MRNHSWVCKSKMMKNVKKKTKTRANVAREIIHSLEKTVDYKRWSYHHRRVLLVLADLLLALYLKRILQSDAKNLTIIATT